MSHQLHIEWDDKSSPTDNARKHLPELAKQYFAQARKLLAKHPAPDELHALRLATKRFRYTLELFRGHYGPTMKTRLAALQRLQTMLGEINDAGAAQRMLDQLAARKTPQSAAIRLFLRTRGEDKSRDFQKHWKDVFDAPGQERQWISYLSRPKRR